MSTISESQLPAAAPEPHGKPLWCGSCGTDAHLMIESVESHQPPTPHVVDVSYMCSECDSFYAHTATVQQVAHILNRPGISYGVLKLGGEYIHCGEPMRTSGSELRSIRDSVTTGGVKRDRALEVYLTTRVLHCSCGFQMEIPDY